ncbi:PREDICTED: protein FAM69C [Nicrophorus vespilloides]|uniref:Protein FAM69C n=1 Tax=Nicrophorus vespilloides TaxID=110193 RepID=A0ABM1N2S2_NICVS|nr:PREDICTED: protein FAM69C [Nicrophorus vespilloides]
MINFRRLPAVAYFHRYTIATFILILFYIVYLLFRWNFICTNAQTWIHVNRICDLFDKGKAVGSICAPLCTNNAIHTLTCHSFKSTKEAVFSGEWHQTRLVFKTASSDVQELHWYDNGVLKYPSEREFLATAKAIVKSKLNITLPQETAVRLTRLKPNYVESDVRKRQKEMDNIWVLLQDNEYLLSNIFTERDIFPQLLGTCGPYFAVEYMDPIQGISSILSFAEDKEEWSVRLRTAIQIIELIEEMENGFQEPFHLCDIKLEHFGIVKGGSRLKFIDLVGVYPRSAINNLIKDTDGCNSDEDCEFLDCRSRCHKSINKCSRKVTNNNLQIICEKIFLGWRMSNTVLIPGLLMTPDTPSELASILRQCANPKNEPGKPRESPDEDTKKRLYNILVEIEQSVTNDFYL